MCGAISTDTVIANTVIADPAPADTVIAAAARALATGDALGALKRVALRDDGPALALSGIAMAQLGDFTRARDFVRRAARAFGPNETVERARCVVAEADIALATRDLRWPTRALDAARDILAKHGDRTNAAYAAHLAVRRLLLIGHLSSAERMLATLDPADFPPVLRASYELIVAGIAMRRVKARIARDALSRARKAARSADVPTLAREVERAHAILDGPVARLVLRGKKRSLHLEEVESLLASDAVVVDAFGYVVRDRRIAVPLGRRPVLFALARCLAEAWPKDVPRAALLARAFRAKSADESHRARLRVEIGRLRNALRTLVEINATPEGFALIPRRATQIAILARPVEEEHAQVLAFLADGESWSSSALALALDCSQRTVQRALDSLAAAGKIHAFGRARARRWMSPPLPGFTTPLLLPAVLESD